MAKAVKTEEKKESNSFQDKLKELDKKYGVGAIIHGKDVAEEIEVVPTGSLLLDIATNIGGWPVGCLIELFGPESSGKTTMILHAIANFQQLEGECIFVNPEQAFDKVYARNIGVNVDKLVISQPDYMENMYNIVEDLIKTGKVRLIIIDSHSASLPKLVVENEIGAATIALQARINSIALGKIKPLLKANRCTVIGLSQLRCNIGGYGDPNVPTGGNAWKFYADMRVKLSKSVDKEKQLNKTTAEIIKNKCACPFGKATFNIGGAKGVDRMQEILDIAVEYKILNKGGAWYTLEGGAKVQGDEGMKAFLRDNEEFAKSLEQSVVKAIAESK